MAKQTVAEYCEMLAERWHIFFKEDLENSIFGTTKYSLTVEEIYIRLSEADENSDRSAFL